MDSVKQCLIFYGGTTHMHKHWLYISSFHRGSNHKYNHNLPYILHIKILLPFI